MEIPFLKMNGAGNEFIVVDARLTPVAFSTDQLKVIANRANLITKGCDQVIVLSETPGGVFMHIYNADGSEVESCGNATRCASWLLMEEAKKSKVTVQTLGGTLFCEWAGDKQVTVDMGPPRLTHAEIPASPVVVLDAIAAEGLKNGMALGMGNPHVVFFVPDVENVDLAHSGPMIENRIDLFPKRVNVSIAQILSEDRIKLRVWERGAGLTLACGTAACATLVAAHKRGFTGKSADVEMPGGVLRIEWREDGHIWMTGPVEMEFKGNLKP